MTPLGLVDDVLLDFPGQLLPYCKSLSCYIMYSADDLPQSVRNAFMGYSLELKSDIIVMDDIIDLVRAYRSTMYRGIFLKLTLGCSS